jgi:Na+-transporting NADH:ubiquinone oxidoreductase subunit E
MTTSAFGILVAAIFANNILLSNFLGVCPFLAGSRRMGTAAALGLAVLFVTTCTVAINYGVYYGLLLGPQEAARLHRPAGLLGADLAYLHLIVFVVVVAGFAQTAAKLIGRRWPELEPLRSMVAVNCVVLGASLYFVIRRYTFAQAVAFGFGAGAGWAMAIVLMAALRRKMAYSDVPRPFQGLAIAMVVTGVMAMALAGLAGLAPIE